MAQEERGEAHAGPGLATRGLHSLCNPGARYSLLVGHFMSTRHAMVNMPK